MTNSQTFDSLVKQHLKSDNTYELQISNFRKFLASYGLEEKVFNLNESHIDDFFSYALEHNIGSESAVVSHIAALKALFNYLIGENLKFSELNGYISTSKFKTDLFCKVEKAFSKPILSSDMLIEILTKVDEYIELNSNGTFRTQTKENTYYEILIARLYIKLSLILPIKPSQLLTFCFENAKNSSLRGLIYNDIVIKLPNSLRQEIIFTINQFEVKFAKTFDIKNGLFVFLYMCIDKKPTTSNISQTLSKMYKELGLHFMLKKISGGKKDKYIYPSECYKLTAIDRLLKNGANIVYLTKLTGLDVGTLISGVNLENKMPFADVVSDNINSSIICCDYFEYI